MVQKNRPPETEDGKCSVVPPQFTAALPRAALSGTAKETKQPMPYCCNGQTRRNLPRKSPRRIDLFGAQLSRRIRFARLCRLTATDGSLEKEYTKLLVLGHRFYGDILHHKSPFVNSFFELFSHFSKESYRC